MRYKFIISILFFVQLSFATIQDSIGLVEQNGKKYILHLVGKETLYSLSRKYNVSLNELKAINPELKQGLKSGQKLMVPIKEKTTIVNSTAPQNDNYVLHQIETSQTLYAISKKYKAKVEDIKRWNNLESNELKVGSYIIVGEKNKLETAEIEDQKKESPEPVAETNDKSVVKKSGDGKVVEKVSASVYETAEGNQFFYILHKTVPVGTIVKILNPQNSNSIFARVSGKQNSTENGIKLTKIAFEKLELSANANVVIEYIAP